MNRYFSLPLALCACLFIACGYFDDSRAPEVIRITPEPGIWLGFREQFTVQFNTPIIPSSGSITYGNSEFGDYTFRLPYSDASDTITWNRCFSAAAGWYGEQIQLIIRDFRDVNDRIQAEAFQVSYNDPPAMLEHLPSRSLPAPAFITDIDPPEMIEYEPSGSRVDPDVTREIRITFDRPILAEFKIIDPPIDGTPHVTNDGFQCLGVARWVFAGTEQLRYATNYRIVLWVSDAAGNRLEQVITFTTKR